MTPIARGQAITLLGSRTVHACWLDDAERDNGDPVVVACCGEWVDQGCVAETQADVDCMACLVDPRRHDDEQG